jgi:hypothetical protein
VVRDKKMNIDPDLKVFVPEYVLKLVHAEYFWLTVLWLSKQNGCTLKKAFEDIDEVYHEYFNTYRYADERAARTAYNRFLKRAKERNKLKLKADTNINTFGS